MPGFNFQNGGRIQRITETPPMLLGPMHSGPMDKKTPMKQYKTAFPALDSRGEPRKIHKSKRGGSR
jgi:hypothetical protein